MATGRILLRLGRANPQHLELKRAHRHGPIVGVTGTGRTVTLQGIIGGFSECGVSYLVADAMDNPSGLAMAGSPPPKPPKSSPPRAAEIGDTDWSYSDKIRCDSGICPANGPQDPHHRQRNGAGECRPSESRLSRSSS